ncbi:MAG: hypothetical protein EZS28_034905 [Streblomastix strix]|uniref:Uncharacterized protein n=1 Tax=Streblomastix strix TaxID=222440 RepID=A0A5J4UGQ1_9EUKA|nr:MAG: hypothetical protein EZS28_034905 [Streblomastix strix]
MTEKKPSTEQVIRRLLVDTTVLTTKLESQLAFFDLPDQRANYGNTRTSQLETAQLQTGTGTGNATVQN